MKEQKKRRKGSVTVLVAVCLVGMLSFVALSIDGGLLMDHRQQVQSAADAAALAAAEDLFLNWNTNQGLDPSGTAKAAAQASAAANGFPSPTVNIPPLSGPFTGQPGYAEVILTYNQQRSFSTIFGSTDNVTVRARAVAEAGYKAAKVGILVLNPSAPGSVTDTGGGTVTIAGSAPLIVDSSAPNAITVTGGGSVTATEIDVTGVPGISGNANAPTINSGQPQTPDPLAYLPAPDPSTMPSYNGVHLTTGTLTINPGVYKGGISVTGGGQIPTLIMNPGIYYMQGGGFNIGGQANLTATGVMIYNAPQKSSDVISITGGGSVTLSPPTTGPYAGISLFQDRTSTNTVSVSGGAGSAYYGTFYVAGGTLSVTGGGTNSIIGSQYISNNLTVNGNGAFTINWSPNQVGKTRILRLVE